MFLPCACCILFLLGGAVGSRWCIYIVVVCVVVCLFVLKGAWCYLCLVFVVVVCSCLVFVFAVFVVLLFGVFVCICF